MAPRVSVIILNYNYGRYLAQAVESVLSQTLPSGEMEVIIVDDGSTDDSAERARPFLDRVRWIAKPNGGQVSAFNAGFRVASGELIALLESDDYWKPGKLARTIERLDQEPAALLAQHWLEQVDAGGRPLPGYSYPPKPLCCDLNDVLTGHIPFAGTSCVVFRAEGLRPYIPFPEDFLFGADICLRVAAALHAPISNVPEVLGCRRLHGRNLFGETLYDDPEKLERTLGFHTAFAGYLRDLLLRHGRDMPAAEILDLFERERLQMEFFLHRYRGEIRAAFQAWRRIVKSLGPKPYTVFKAVSLLLAMISPRLFLRLQRFYASSALKNLRRDKPER
jgi:glycosyltransferase involved in cell wall biosynthesis